MSNNSVVAVITRTKNRDILLERAIRSVCKQTYKDWVMVIVNDGGVPRIVEECVIKNASTELRKKIIILHNKESLGMEAASNIGITSCNSKYIVIHDDDDSWHPLFLEKSVDFLETSKDYQGVITHSIVVYEKIIDQHVNIISEADFNSWIEDIYLWRMLASNLFPPISFLFKREVYNQIGGFLEELPVLGDWEFNIRFLLKCNIGVIPQQLSYYHHRLEVNQDSAFGNSVISGVDKHKKYRNILQNMWLRTDIQNGNIGLGVISHIASNCEESITLLHVLKLKKTNILVRIVYKLYNLCKKNYEYLCKN